GGEPRCVAPPLGAPCHESHVARHVSAFEQRHPEMPGGMVAVVIFRRGENAAAGAKAAKVHNGLGEDRKARRHGAMWSSGQALAQSDLQLVEYPAVVGIPPPRLRVIGWDEEIRRTLHLIKVLVTPGRWLDDRHLPRASSSGCGASEDSYTSYTRKQRAHGDF